MKKLILSLFLLPGVALAGLSTGGGAAGGGGGGDALTTNPLSQFAPTTSAQLLGVMSDETGSGLLTFATNPVLTTPNLGTPSALTLTNATGLPIGGITGLGTGVGTFLGTPSSTNLISAVTDETGSGALVFATSPTFVTPVLGTPSSGNGTNLTALNASQLTTGTVGTARLGSGTANSTTFLRGDQTWAAGGGGTTLTDSASLRTALSDENGTGAALFDFATSPTFVTPFISTVASVAGADLNLNSTASTAITTSQTGKDAKLTASAATAGTSVAGAADGGGVTITAGNANRFTSGSANGGGITLNTGNLIGAGVTGQIFFQIAGVTRIGISSAGNLNFSQDNANDLGASGAGRPRDVYIGRNEVITGLTATAGAAPTIASATTIAPTTAIAFVSGTTPVATITAPSPISTAGGQITLIPTGAFTTTTGGNIALASTAVVSKALIMTYDVTAVKWYPSY